MMREQRYKAVAYLLLRLTVGLVFFFYGFNKLMGGLSGFAAGMTERMADTPLPGILITPFAYLLPFAELIVGTLLVLGLFTRGALVAAALLMAALTVGVVLEPSPPTVAANVNYALVIFVLLWLSEFDGYSLDAMRQADRER